MSSNSLLFWMPAMSGVPRKALECPVRAFAFIGRHAPFQFINEAEVQRFWCMFEAWSITLSIENSAVVTRLEQERYSFCIGQTSLEILLCEACPCLVCSEAGRKPHISLVTGVLLLRVYHVTRGSDLRSAMTLCDVQPLQLWPKLSEL